MTKIRALRHWKQRFDKGAVFIWRKGITWDGKPVTAGTRIPESLANNAVKLRRFWEANIIELALFDEPDVATGKAPEPQSQKEEDKTDGEDSKTSEDTDDSDAEEEAQDESEDETSSGDSDEEPAEAEAESSDDDSWLDEGKVEN